MAIIKRTKILILACFNTKYLCFHFIRQITQTLTQTMPYKNTQKKIPKNQIQKKNYKNHILQKKKTKNLILYYVFRLQISPFKITKKPFIYK